MKRNRKVLAGLLIGLSVALKLITWPLIIYLIVKKDWRTVISSILTALILNLIAFSWMGIGPFMEYYLKVSTQVLEIYHKFWANFSMFALGYRLFEGTDSAIFANNFHAPPLINSPAIAPLVSIVFVILFLSVSMVWAIRSYNLETSFAILVNLMVAISLAVMLRNLVMLAFPTRLTFVYVIIFLLLFIFNDWIGTVLILLNGGVDVLRANGNQLTFVSSLISWLPLLELVALTILLWKSGKYLEQEAKQNHPGMPVEATVSAGKCFSNISFDDSPILGYNPQA